MTLGDFLHPGENPRSLRRSVRIAISVAIRTAPRWVKKESQIAAAGHDEMVERIAEAVERFELRWPGDTVADLALPPPNDRTGDLTP